jgi:hypothetical protein
MTFAALICTLMAVALGALVAACAVETVRGPISWARRMRSCSPLARHGRVWMQERRDCHAPPAASTLHDRHRRNPGRRDRRSGCQRRDGARR